MDPQTLLYTESHEWVHVTEPDVTGSRVATIGISAFAVEQLTDLVYMQLPKVGKSLKAGDEFGEVESVKAVSGLYSPVSGLTIEVNSDLPQNLDSLKTDPYGAGWMIRVRLANPAELSELLTASAYAKQCAEQS
jgi:glycine cleavage system H protein